MIGTALLNSLWQGIFITALAALGTIMLPQRQAATRYAMWFVALLAIIILPVLSASHSTASVAGLPGSVIHAASVASRATEQTASASGSWLLSLWLAGFGLCLVRLGLSYYRVSKIVRGATAAPELGAGVMISDDLSVPIAAGLFTPVIVVPARLVTLFERSDLDAILQHELAHIRRMDVLGNFIQRIMEACLFFNPWVYVIGRQLIKEREAACDDWALQATRDPDRYASCLSQVAQAAAKSRRLLLTPSAIGSGSLLLARIARVLDGKAGQLKINYLALASSVIAFAVLGMLLQTPRGLASSGFVHSGTAANLVASASCPNPNADVKPLNAAAPNIPKPDYQPGLSARALVTVEPNGHPAGAKIVKSSGNAAIDRATVNAAMASTYSPAVRSCQPVTGTYLFQVQTGPIPAPTSSS